MTEPRICSNCDDPDRSVYAKGLCARCYGYQRKRGKPRPLDLASPRVLTTDELIDAAARFMRGEILTKIAASMGNVKATNLANAITGKTLRYRYILEYVPGHHIKALRTYKARYGSRKLTPGQARDLRRRRAGGAFLSTLARRYHLCESAVSKIARGEGYAEVGGPISESHRAAGDDDAGIAAIAAKGRM